jgi:hypothetical protein
MNLDNIFLEYLEALGDPIAWHDDKLHVSDLGMCHRMVMLRLLGGAEVVPVSDDERRRTLSMFYLGNHEHEMVYKALERKGMLIDKETKIIGLPDGWRGRLDAVIEDGNGPRILDVKTKKYLAKRATYPPYNNALQVATYHIYMKKHYGLKQSPILYYIQRDLDHHFGIIAEVDVNEETENHVRSEMSLLDSYRNKLPDLPPTMEKVMKYDKKTGVVSLLGHHYCHPNWCDYFMTACKPDMEEEILATINDFSIVLTDAGKKMEEEVFEFIRTET